LFNKYYQDELTYLRDLGREFAREYPALAPVLGQSGTDPDVERLLEGVAFLTGRVRQKLDDEFPEIIHSTASLLFPHLLRPIPALSILEIVPTRQGLRDRRVVAAGAEFDTTSIDGTALRFSSTRDCEVLPWTLEGTRLQPGASGRTTVTFQLNVAPGLTLGQLRPDKVRIHVTEETRIALLLTYFLVEHCHSVTIAAKSPNQKSPDVLTLSAKHIRHVGLEDDDALLPHTEHLLPGFRLVEEYFLLPQKFAFFEISGFGELSQTAPKATSLEVSIELDSHPPLAHALSADCLRLHCVPIVNVFNTTAEPIRISPERERYLVRPAALPRDRSSVYALLGVTGINRSSDRRSPVRPFFDYAHAFEADAALCYVTSLQPGTIGNDVDLFIAVDRPGSTAPLDLDILSIELLATNGPLGGQVRAGDVTVPTPTSPAFAQFHNLVAATPYIPVLLGKEVHWRVIAHLATGLRTLADPNVLRAALRTYNFQGLLDRQAARAADLRIDAIRKLGVSPTERLYRGAVVRGIDVQIELDETGFSGEGDMYLFGAVLDRVFASYVPLNSFALTTFTGLSSRVTKTFAPRSGSVEII
jgi:type VI secretion system protein ImpG